MITFARKLFRTIDFLIAAGIFFFFSICLLIKRLFGKIQIALPQNKVLSLTKDGVYKILECNGSHYFEWDFTRPYADTTYVLFVGDEKPNVFKLSKKIVGMNVLVPLENYKHFFPFTIRLIQEIIGFLTTVQIIKKISPKVIEVMFPSKLALRALFLKWLLPVKLVTQVRGNLDLIYYFNPFACFWPFKITAPYFEFFQVIWDKFISLVFYRACDLVIGYNVNNMLSAISNGAHPAKTKLSRIKIELSMLNVKRKERVEINELPTTGKIISLWSRLSSEKLVLESIKAFEKLLSQVDEDLHFVIMGDGPEKLTILSYLEQSIYKNKIHILGKKDRDFIAQVALHSCLSLVPYGGGSLVEAVMLNVPVVAFDIEWHNELIRDGETGYLSDFPDTDHLAQKMLEALLNPEESQRRALAAKELALKMFNEETTNSKEARYYKSLFS